MRNKTNINKSKDWLRNQAGFSLLEVLLSVVLMGMIAVSLMQMAEDWAEDEEANMVAQHLNTVREATREYVMDNFNAIHTYVTANGPIEVALRDNAAVHGFFIGDNNDKLPFGFSDSNPYGQTVTVLMRAPAFPAATERVPRALEVVIVTGGRRVDDERLLKASQLAGGHAGYISAIDRPGTACCTGIIQGAFGGWTVDIDPVTSPYNATAWLPANTPNVAQGGYLASYLWVNQSDEIGDYLYNTGIAGLAEANTMFANLVMSSNDILGADDVTVNTNVTASSGARLKGAVETTSLSVNNGDLFSPSIATGGNLTIQNDLAVAGNMDAGTLRLTGELVANSGTIDTASVNTGVNATTVNNSNNIIGNADIFSQSMTGSVLSVGGGNVLRAGSLDITGNLTTHSVVADSADIGGNLTGPSITIDRSGTTAEVTIFGGTVNIPGSYSCPNCTTPGP